MSSRVFPSPTAPARALSQPPVQLVCPQKFSPRHMCHCLEDACPSFSLLPHLADVGMWRWHWPSFHHEDEANSGRSVRKENPGLLNDPLEWCCFSSRDHSPPERSVRRQLLTQSFVLWVSLLQPLIQGNSVI